MDPRDEARPNMYAVPSACTPSGGVKPEAVATTEQGDPMEGQGHQWRVAARAASPTQCNRKRAPPSRPLGIASG